MITITFIYLRERDKIERREERCPEEMVLDREVWDRELAGEEALARDAQVAEEWEWEWEEIVFAPLVGI